MTFYYAGMDLGCTPLVVDEEHEVRNLCALWASFPADRLSALVVSVTLATFPSGCVLHLGDKVSMYAA